MPRIKSLSIFTGPVPKPPPPPKEIDAFVRMKPWPGGVIFDLVDQYGDHIHDSNLIELNLNGLRRVCDVDPQIGIPLDCEGRIQIVPCG